MSVDKTKDIYIVDLDPSKIWKINDQVVPVSNNGVIKYKSSVDSITLANG